MSVKIMSAIFESEALGPTERLIMLALADHADDSGRCYPSIERLCKRTGLSERAIQSNIRKLSDAGYLTIISGGGRNRPNLYIVRANPAAETPQQKPRIKNTVYDDVETPQQMRENPAADAPEPSGTIKEPSKRRDAHLLSILSEVVKPETAADFIAHRCDLGAKLTERAAKMIATDLRGRSNADQAMRESIKNGWKGVFPDKQVRGSDQQRMTSQWGKL